MQLDLNLRAGRWRRTPGVVLGTTLEQAAGRLTAVRERAGALAWQGVALFAALLSDPGFLLIADPTRRFLGFCLAALWLARAAAEAPAARSVRILLPALLAVMLIPWAPGVALGPALAAALLLGARGASIETGIAARSAAWAIAALGLWRWSVGLTEPGWQLSGLAASAVSTICGWAAAVPVELGADVAGVPILLAVLATAVTRAAEGRRGAERRGALLAVLGTTLLAALCGLVAVARWVPESPAPASISLRHLVLFAALLPALGLASPGRARPTAGAATANPTASPLTPGARAALALVALCILLSAGLWMRRPVSLAGVRIGIFTESSAAWQTSAEAGPGGIAAPTIGDGAALLAALGARVERLGGSLDTTTLAELDTLILPTPSRAFTSGEARALTAFVRGGGGLMALAEHTDLGGNRRHLNPILQSFGIRVNNDSALAVPGEPWRSAFAVRPHAVLPGEVSPDRHGMAIGASLSVTGGGRPLLVGRGLFADAAAAGPDPLGDLIYARPERLGDVVVAATASPGSGRVLVFGDPSPLMNYPLHSTDAMIARAAGWLAGRIPDVQGPLTAGFLASAALALLGTPGRRWGQRLLVAALAAPLAVLLAPADALAVPPPLPAGRAAIIDRSHRPMLATGDSFTTSTAGLARNLRRAGLIPTRMDAWDGPAVARAGALLLFSPTRDLSRPEAAAIDRMLQRGGTLLVAMGGVDQPALPRLVELLGASVAATPLGPVAAALENAQAHFPAAWAIEARDAGYRTLLSQWGRPVVVEARRGAGRIVLVSDPAVFLGEQMEGHERFDAGNIALFRRLVAGESACDAHEVHP